MKVLVLICVLALAALASARDYEKVMKFDFQAFLDNNEKSGYNYRYMMDCFLGKMTCPTMDVELKENLMEILNTDCAHCSAALKQKYNWVLAKLEEERPEDYDAIMNKVSYNV